MDRNGSFFLTPVIIGLVLLNVALAVGGWLRSVFHLSRPEGILVLAGLVAMIVLVLRRWMRPS